jgi:hypothetical protein
MNAQHLLDVALFVGWKDKTPLFIVEFVIFDARDARAVHMSCVATTAQPDRTEAEEQKRCGFYSRRV